MVWKRTSMWLLLGLLLTWGCLYGSGCTLVGCDSVCGKQFSCNEGNIDRDKCLEECRAKSDAGQLCQAYYNCWNTKACNETSECVDVNALCP
ncbi:MAG: hypothetical protein EP343_01475 [Deltaproteobacteria bacterium]|nr:MAG: hypothetical protein EP343_01475 [Deltaproteobacteria bacterium]